MLRLSTSLCPFCEASAVAKTLRTSAWPSQRNASTLQKRKPSRMLLSAKVARGPPKTVEGGGARPIRRTRNSPWGGMNTTTPPREVQYASHRNKISAAEHKRQTRMRPGKAGAEEKTKEPMKALKMQRALASVSYEARSRVKQELLEKDSFAEFDLLPIIKQSVETQALRGIAHASPTPVQRLAIPALLGMDDGKRRKRKPEEVQSARKQTKQFLLAAETGSGKTLAYVLPVIDAIKRAEAAEAAEVAAEAAREETSKKYRLFEIDPPEVDDSHPTTGRPRALILLPTAELVSQVGALLKSLSHTVKFRAAMLSAAVTGTVIRSRLFSPGGIDVVISTPHLLSSITDADPNILSRVSHIVVDEADSLLDRSFSPITSAIIDRAAPSLEQLIFCSATIPRSLDAYLTKRYPAVHRLATPNLHAIPRRVQLSVVDIEKVPYQGNRDLACAQTIWEIGKEAADEYGDEPHLRGTSSGVKKIVVFVNEREKTLELAAYLNAKGIDASALSRDSDERNQAETLAAFTGAAIPGSSKTPPSALPPPPRPTRGPTTAFLPAHSSHSPSTHPPPRRRLTNTKVLVMTDIGSRGIDTLLVKHVILYDVPHTSIDFIHRLGRVGRMGRRGRGVVLVGKNDRRDVVREVREGMFRGSALI